MKFALKTLLILFVLHSNVEASFVTIKKITTKKTKDYVAIPNTNMSILLPDDYKQSNEFIGYGNKKGNAIIISKKTKTLAETYKEILEHQTNLGYTLVDEKTDITFNGNFEAYYIKTVKDTTVHLFLVLSNNGLFYVFEGKAMTKHSEKEIRNALLSVYIAN
jgi:hypothetical protein